MPTGEPILEGKVHVDGTLLSSSLVNRRPLFLVGAVSGVP
jgi:hypothetical protein